MSSHYHTTDVSLLTNRSWKSFSSRPSFACRILAFISLFSQVCCMASLPHLTAVSVTSCRHLWSPTVGQEQCEVPCDAWVQHDSWFPGTRNVLKRPQDWVPVAGASNVLPPGWGEAPSQAYKNWTLIPKGQRFILSCYRVLGLGYRSGKHFGRNVLLGCVNTAPGKSLWSLFNKCLYNTEALQGRAPRDRRANNKAAGLRTKQLNTKMTANYTMKHKRNTSQKLSCYFKSQPHVMKESGSPFLRGWPSHRVKNQVSMDSQHCEAVNIPIGRLERWASTCIRGRKHQVIWS